MYSPPSWGAAAGGRVGLWGSALRSAAGAPRQISSELLGMLFSQSGYRSYQQMNVAVSIKKWYS